MRGSITEVFKACAAATGRTFVAPQRGTVTFCCLHGNTRTPSLSIRENYGSFRCFGCGAKGGLLQAVVAFELAEDLSESSHWLAARGLIPPKDSSLATGERKAFTPKAIYTNHQSLSLEMRVDRALALWSIEDVIGVVRMRAAIDLIAEWRYTIKTQIDSIAKRVVSLMLSPPDVVTGMCPHNITYRLACELCMRKAFA